MSVGRMLAGGDVRDEARDGAAELDVGLREQLRVVEVEARELRASRRIGGSRP